MGEPDEFDGKGEAKMIRHFDGSFYEGSCKLNERGHWVKNGYGEYQNGKMDKECNYFN
jgi:hypothetical protein